jgi:copper(I)-binding protein
MEDLGYAYLHSNLLDKATLTTITLRVKLPYIEMHEQHLQKGMFMKVENFDIKPKSKRGFEKGDMHVIITLN